MTDFEIYSLQIPAEAAGQRLDKVLAELWPDFSRSRLQHWIKSGAITLDGSPVSQRMTVAGDEEVILEYRPEKEVSAEPEAISLDVVFEDEALLVINKPPGLVVHPGAGNPGGTLQNALLHHAPELANVPRAGLIHRLDKDTSGLLVVARNEAAHAALSRAMKLREIQREYCAVVSGVMTAGGHVDAPIGRHPRDRKRMAVKQGGREAVTHYRVGERFRKHSYLRLKLETGRTHQIRVHMAHIQYPIVGDPVYGRRLGMPAGASEALKSELQTFKRQALHARNLGLQHPSTGESCKWQAPMPDDMRRLLTALREDAQQAAEND